VLRRDDLELRVAGRTDRGVHATGQVVSYAGEPPDLRGVNALLGGDVAVRAAEVAPEGFDARRDALSRTYAYRVHAAPTPSPFERAYALWWPRPLDQAALHACAEALRGEHDFTAFTPTDTYHVRFQRRILDAAWEREGEILRFRIEADAFMRQMNRVLVGTMLEVAQGRRDLDSFRALLAGRPRSEAGPTAPPHGLYLIAVHYSDWQGSRPSVMFRGESL
jgi:tRNA pseudouridine38-40 synthase